MDRRALFALGLLCLLFGCPKQGAVEVQDADPTTLSGPVGDPRTVLLSAAADPDPTLRAAALEVLRALNKDLRGFVPAIFELQFFDLGKVHCDHQAFG